MAYDEVGGCRKSGFFHGECPILETGRQSHAKAKEQEKAAHRVTMRIWLFVLAVWRLIPLWPRKNPTLLGFIYGCTRNTRQSVCIFYCRFIGVPMGVGMHHRHKNK